MAQPIKTKTWKITNRRLVQLPSVFIEENNIIKDCKLSVLYGCNYKCVIVIPDGTKLSDRTLERISILVNESLA